MKKEYSHKLSLIENTHWWSVARRKIIENVLQRLKLDDSIDILELGCGIGGNLELLSHFGNVFATDSDDFALNLALRRHVGNVEKGCLPNHIPFGSKKFDLILMLDVLEHIEDDISSLKIIKNRLKIKGKILLTVPAYPFLWSRIDLDSGHQRRYLKNQLSKLIQKAGLRVEYITYFNTLLFPVIGMIRLLNKIRGRHDNLDLKMPSSFANTLLMEIFSFEKKIIPKLSMPFGVSILAIGSIDD